MINRTKAFVFAAASCAAIALPVPLASAGASPANYFGNGTAGTTVDRIVTVTPETKHVMVRDGDNILFVVQDRDTAPKWFAWHFERCAMGEDPASVISLSDIAPANLRVAHPIGIYVYRNWL